MGFHYVSGETRHGKSPIHDPPVEEPDFYYTQKYASANHFHLTPKIFLYGILHDKGDIVQRIF